MERPDLVLRLLASRVAAADTQDMELMGIDLMNVLAVIVIFALPILAAVGLANFNRHLRRLEAAADRLQCSVDRMERQTKGVAKDLAESHRRANEVDGPDGAAADAALRTAS